jgi:VIT1/CCC1 family predicted Fe2+/Mn2+ transporter/rubrerythrin
MTSVRSKTETNLQVALAGEADANRRYLAYGIQALYEGRPEIAQLFFEAAGAETIHALNHLRTMRAIGTTRENLEHAATGEVLEIDVVLPRMISEAEEEGRADAAASFRLALERERHHRDMFRGALKHFEAGPSAQPAPAARRAERPEPAPAIAPPPAAPWRAASSDRGLHEPGELQTEARRIERLASIREVVFGAQDALVSTFAVVAGLAAAGVGPLVVLLGGLVSAAAGVLSMSIGTFLAARAQRQLYENELDRERREIREHPGEEMAELIAALIARGMPRGDASEVVRRIARYPDLMLSTLSVFELGLVPQRLGTPVRDAFVMAAAFGGSAMIPLLPFMAGRALPALMVSAALTLLALFAVGVVKSRVGGVSPIRSGLEVVVLAAGSAALSFGLGRMASLALGVDLH